MTDGKGDAAETAAVPASAADEADLLETLGHSLRTAAEWQTTLLDAIESISDAFGLFDAEDRLILCNQRYAQTFTNYNSFKEIEGWHFTDLVRASVARGEIIEPEFADDVEAWVAERTRRHRTPGGSMRQIHLADGTWLQVSERPTRAGGIVGVRTDITELKAAQHAAEAANESKTHFLRNMSHEIRTPMNGVLGMAQLLAETRLDSTQRRYVEAIEQSGRHLLGIINDILDFSKVESGLFVLEKAELDLRRMIEDCAAMLAQAAHAKGLELVVDIDPEAGIAVVGDPLRLQQIIINLVNNAIKFTEQGDITLSLQHRFSDDQAIGFDIIVADSGVGIPAELHEHIFDHFAQADGSTARKFGGTGLGLTICRQLARLMGGDIMLSSVPGVGSTFRVSLTLPRGAPPPPATPAPAFMADRRVLLVDDHARSRALLAEQLAAFGLAVTECGTAAKALALLQDAAWARCGFDLALLDTSLPDGDGLTLARTIRSSPALGAVKLILLSATANIPDGDRERLALVGSLAKPVKRDDLARMVIAALSAAPAKPPAGKADPKPALPKLTGKILLAEDNDVNKFIVVSWLERLGITASHARNGREAVDMAEQEDFDLILMDCQMPELDGFAATREIRRREAGTGRHTPIVALTANAIDGDRDSCLKAGMDDYLTKPFKGAQLTDLILQWFPGALRTPAPASAPFDAALLSGLLAIAPEEGRHLRRQIIDLFLLHAPLKLAALRAALSSGSLSAVAGLARELVQAARPVGAAILADLAESLAIDAENGNEAAATRRIGDLATEQARLCQSLAALRDQAVP
jgi:signal transduction histidine kinase/DNA-binding response OmpR family regulator